MDKRRAFRGMRSKSHDSLLSLSKNKQNTKTMNNRNYSVVVAYPVGRRDRNGYRNYEVVSRVDGFTPEQAEETMVAFNGRLYGQPRIRVVASALDGMRVGDTFREESV